MLSQRKIIQTSINFRHLTLVSAQNMSNGLSIKMIIYPRKFLNPENVITLFQSDQLNPGEMGWYQVLNGVSNVEHRSFNGWVNHDRNVLTKFFYSSSGEMVRLRPAAIFSMVRDEVLRLRRTLMKRFRLFRKI